MLESDPDLAKEMICCEKISFDTVEDQPIEQDLCEDILQNITNMSCIYHIKSSDIIKKEDLLLEDESNEIQEESEKEKEKEKKEKKEDKEDKEDKEEEENNNNEEEKEEEEDEEEKKKKKEKKKEEKEKKKKKKKAKIHKDKANQNDVDLLGLNDIINFSSS